MEPISNRHCRYLYYHVDETVSDFVYIGVHDIQLMKLATRTGGNRKYIIGLAGAITKHAGLSSQQAQVWNEVKERGVALFSPEKGVVSLFIFFFHCHLRVLYGGRRRLDGV